VKHQQYTAWLRARAQARFRGETWEITFDDWLEIWGDQWHLRGRSRNSLMMMRRDWRQPWSRSNTWLGNRAHYHYQHMQKRLESGNISQINMTRPEGYLGSTAI